MNDNILHKRLVGNMQKNVDTLGHILTTITLEQAKTWRDGADGWTILEVIGHLVDFDGIFMERGEMMLAEDHPTFLVYDHLAMVVDHAYNAQDLAEAFARLTTSREKFVAFFSGLSEADWQRTGNHVEHGRFTIESLAAHVAWHDANHLEQITRIIAENR